MSPLRAKESCAVGLPTAHGFIFWASLWPLVVFPLEAEWLHAQLPHNSSRLRRYHCRHLHAIRRKSLTAMRSTMRIIRLLGARTSETAKVRAKMLSRVRSTSQRARTSTEVSQQARKIRWSTAASSTNTQLAHLPTGQSVDVDMEVNFAMATNVVFSCKSCMMTMEMRHVARVALPGFHDDDFFLFQRL